MLSGNVDWQKALLLRKEKEGKEAEEGYTPLVQ